MNRTSPVWLAVIAVVSLGALVALTSASVLRLVRPPEEFVEESAVAVSSPEPSSDAGPSPSAVAPVESGDSWLGQLFATDCPVPCSAGSACATPGPKLDTCITGATCVPGAPADVVADDDQLALYLSAIYWEDDPPRDPCRTGRDLWMCVRAQGAAGEQCASQLEACQNAPHDAARSLRPLLLTGQDLRSSGVRYTLREGGPDGEVLVEREFTFGGSLLRTALCRGIRVPLSDRAGDRVAFLVGPR